MTLRPLRKADVASLATWLPKTAADAGCEHWSNETALRDALGEDRALVTDGCFLALEAGVPREDALRIDFLAVPPGLRRLGTGSRSALALEKRARRSVDAIYVLVPARLGLALYFWLRLGYRPLLQPDWPAEVAEASVWMKRTVR
jgi:GNAT superfamily N-acetyltransferase